MAAHSITRGILHLRPLMLRSPPKTRQHQVIRLLIIISAMLPRPTAAFSSTTKTVEMSPRPRRAAPARTAAALSSSAHVEIPAASVLPRGYSAPMSRRRRSAGRVRGTSRSCTDGSTRWRIWCSASRSCARVRKSLPCRNRCSRLLRMSAGVLRHRRMELRAHRGSRRGKPSRLYWQELVQDAETSQGCQFYEDHFLS